MPLIRILVDGYSLLHAWPELARGSARHSAMSRDARIASLGEYQAALGTPITVFFDGQSGGSGPRTQKTDPKAVEVLYSKAGQTADDLIEGELKQVHLDLKHHNRRERDRYQRDRLR